MTRIDGQLNVTVDNASTRQDRSYSSEEVIAVLDGNLQGGGGGGGDGGGGVGRTQQKATYITTTVSPTVYYTGLDTDGTTVITPRTLLNVSLLLQGGHYSMYGFDQPLEQGRLDWISVWDEGDPNVFAASWEVVGGPSGLTTGGGGGGGGGLAVAAFNANLSISSVLVLDATTSTATSYAWEIDGAPRPETSAIVTYGPLLVGGHNVKLTVTNSADGSIDVLTTAINVAWVAEPITQSQHDNTNGQAGGGVSLGQWPTELIGPWRNIQVLNEQDGGDNVARMVSIGDGSATFLVKTGDEGIPGSGLEINDAYNGAGSGFPLALGTDINVCGNINAPVGDDTTGATRFYRVEFKIPSVNADATTAPNPLVYMNNVFAIQGNAPSDGIVTLGPNTAGTKLEAHFNALPNGASASTATASSRP